MEPLERKVQDDMVLAKKMSDMEQVNRFASGLKSNVLTGTPTDVQQHQQQ